MLKGAFEHVGNDLHIAVAMRIESRTRLNPILVDHTQRSEAHVRGIMVVSERETVETVEPAMVRMAARLC